MQIVQLRVESAAVEGLGVGVLEDRDFLIAMAGVAFLSGTTCIAEEAAGNQNA